MEDFISGLPKAELHMHIEGSLQPELMFEIAIRNGISIPYKTVDELKQAYNFSNLQDFLDIYYAGAGVLTEVQDFYDMTYDYLKKAHSQNIIHAELFFDPQTHTSRGVTFEKVITGIHQATQAAFSHFGMSIKLIMCFLRHLDEESAIKTLKEALPYKHLITGVGLDSSELGHPPSKFRKVFEMSREEGLHTVAHAGEEGPPEYVWQALELLKVSRIDHGNRSLEDEKLLQELVKLQMPLTVCPLSNLKLRVVDELHKHPLRNMMQRGLLVTINSDDPAYFGGYLNENYLAMANALHLTKDEIAQLAKNSFVASFITESEKASYIEQVDAYCSNFLK